MPLLDIFWSMLLFFLFVGWIWLLISIFGDIFRSDLTGGAKAVWTVFVVLVPLIGVLAYLLVHGGEMQDRSVQHAAKVRDAQQAYIRDAAGTSASTADELSKLAQLHDAGVISDDEFGAQKAKLLA
jgi:hypothetical protein